MQKASQGTQETNMETIQETNSEATQETNIEATQEVNMEAIQETNIDTTDETACEKSAPHNKVVIKELSSRSSTYGKIEDKIAHERMETFYPSRNVEQSAKNNESIDISSKQDVFDIENILEDNEVQVQFTDSQEIDLQLKYGDENDDVHLNIAMKEDTLFLKVGSEQQETLELLKNNIESLRRDLLQKGLKLHDVEFSRNFSQSFSQNSHNRGNQHFLQQRFSAKVEENAREVNPNQIYYSNKKVSYYI